MNEDEKVAKLLAEHYQKGREECGQDIIRIIEKDIEYQKTKLQNDFHKDKALSWRITGMEFIIQKIRNLNQEGNVE